ncbi:MAG: aldo/keto reductase [Clostridia bacterium]|nr:aldo/keto reductase [Clostridia bacterium]
MQTNNKNEKEAGMDRRSFITKTIIVGASVAAFSSVSNRAYAQTQANRRAESSRPGTRKLGKLEVSAIGMGVQNMHRKYDTTVPYRPEMIALIHSAIDRGVTFFDTAECYGPFTNEELVGEALEPFRDKVVVWLSNSGHLEKHDAETN